MKADGLTAEELILKILKEKKEAMERGIFPSKVIMHSEHYRRIKLYRLQIGSYPGGVQDYMTDDSVFGLEICLDNSVELSVTG